jgi:hypothetical protein
MRDDRGGMRELAITLLLLALLLVVVWLAQLTHG